MQFLNFTKISVIIILYLLNTYALSQVYNVVMKKVDNISDAVHHVPLASLIFGDNVDIDSSQRLTKNLSHIQTLLYRKDFAPAMIFVPRSRSQKSYIFQLMCAGTVLLEKRSLIKLLIKWWFWGTEHLQNHLRKHVRYKSFIKLLNEVDILLYNF